MIAERGFATHYQEYEESGIDTISYNERQKDQYHMGPVGEFVDDYQEEIGNVVGNPNNRDKKKGNAQLYKLK